MSEQVFVDALDGEKTHPRVMSACRAIRRLGETVIPHSGIGAGTLLFSLMHYAPGASSTATPAGSLHVANEILKVTDKAGTSEEEKLQALLDLAQAWFQHLLVPIHSITRVRTAAPSDSETPTLQDTETLIEKASCNDQKALRSLLFKRQNGRCYISGLQGIKFGREIDPTLTPVDRIKRLAKPYRSGEIKVAVDATHIIPFALSSVDTREKLYNSAVTWQMLKAWCSLDINDYVRDKMNTAQNVLLMEVGLHATFRKFYWFLDPVMDTEGNALPNRYIVCSGPGDCPYDSEEIEFTTADPMIALPDPKLISIHTAFAKVLYASAAGDYLDYTWDSLEDQSTLASDGSSDAVALGLLGFQQPAFTEEP